MNRHASMNRIYRLIWSAVRGVWIPAAENTRGQGKRVSRTLAAATLVAATSTAATLALGSAYAQAGVPAAGASGGPSGGVISAGSGSIAQSGALTTITQASPRLSLTWNSFNIPAHDTVDFVQPSASAIAVNRILDVNGTQILGHLNANGQLYLINPDGIVFGPGAEVNVGGLVASTLALATTTLPGDAQSFSADGAPGTTGAGSVINQGSIHAAPGGYVALLATHVGNSGVISAQLGTVALGAGSAATLRFRNTHLVSMQIDQSVLHSVADNGGLIRADGGQVLMTAGAQKALLASVVNNTGVIEARTLDNHDGAITLLGGMSAGTVNESGTLDASAPGGGNGGAIETSATHVKITDTAKITTAAAMGLNGTWLIDPTDFTISAGTDAQSTSGIGATTLQNDLANGNVSIATGAAGSQNGDINVDAPVSWAANKLALTAAHDINVNAVMTASGTASLDLAPATDNVNMAIAADGTFAGRIDFSGSGTLRMMVGGTLTANGTEHTGGTLQVFTVINTLGAASDATSGSAQTLQGMARLGNLTGNFALGSNIDASATANWNPCTVCSATLGAGHYGFQPIGNFYTPSGTTSQNQFSGTFDGLGHVISGLTISQNNPGLTNGSGVHRDYYVGLFGYVAAYGVIRNVGLVNANVLGGLNVGVLAGQIGNYGAVTSSYSTGNVSGKQGVGGLVGEAGESVFNNDYSTTTVTSRNNNTPSYSMGGLVGATSYATITNSHTTGAVSGSGYVGGLVGTDYGGSVISKSYATGNITAAGFNYGSSTVSYVGGLVGYGGSSTFHAGVHIDNSYFTGTVNAAAGSLGAGGLAGFTYAGSTIDTSYSTATVTGGNQTGGLVGVNHGAVTNSYFAGSVTGGAQVGGLVGMNYSGAAISTSHSTGAVTGSGSGVGGLVGQNYGSIATSYATGAVSGGNYVGGLVGQNEAQATVTTSFAVGSVTGGRYTGGLVGTNYGAVSNSYATGSVTGSLNVGGLVGENGTGTGSVADSYAVGSVSGGSYVGALVGAQFGTVTNSLYSTTANSTLTGFGSNSGGVADVAGTVMGLTTAQLQAQANFTSATTANGGVNPGWDLDSNAVGTSVWFIYEGETAPLLRVFMTPLTVTGTVTQTYNGAVFAPTISHLTYSIVPDTSHLFGTVTVDGTAVGATHVGTYSFTPGGMYSDQLGYLISYSPGSLTIDKAPLTVVGSTANKVYDGTTVAPVIDGTLVGLFGSDTVTLMQAGTFASKNAGTGIAVTAHDSIGGADTSDYTLIEPTRLTGTITAATLTVSGTRVGEKVYNGTTAADLTNGSLVGVLGGDTVTLLQAGNFASAGVGSGIAVIASDTLAGPSALDYRLTQPAGLSGTITAAGGSTPGPGSPLLAAYYASAQVDANLIAPQWGATPQVIDASPSIDVVATASEPASTDAGVDQNSPSSDSGQGIVINVAMKIGATGTLKIESGGLRLPVTHLEGNP